MNILPNSQCDDDLGLDHVPLGDVGGRFFVLGDPLYYEEEVEDGLKLSLVLNKEDKPTPLNVKLLG